ncbi:AAEL010422-PA [Aedes aegypti]|uniref:AAEL010422-PA n=2 Tax=Aedes aegypti TaxID=7159 RepID=A0A1S4FQP6_AEDAE|nr:histone RNA hairpin-binding protein [Aedes aegypti]EAT37613.1 AAEL010422-PA [Aedes aegypti]
MALACEDSRMSLDGSDLSNLSPCKPTTVITDNNKAPSLSKTTATDTTKQAAVSSPERRSVQNTEEQNIGDEAQKPGSKSEQIESLSWADIVESAENKKNEEESETAGAPLSDLVGSDTKMSMDESNSNASMRSNGSSSRQIEIDILDSANVEKYEKLVRNEKIKSPFKRRLSGGEDDDDGADDDDGHAKFVDAEENGTLQHNLHKKSKMNENDHGRERFRRDSSSSSGDGSSQSSRKPVEYEKDLSILERRQKQIDYGKNTLGYENYMKQVPREKRTNDHPKTPPKHIKYSRRAWDGLIKVWRKKLHCFDPDAKPEADA